MSEKIKIFITDETESTRKALHLISENGETSLAVISCNGTYPLEERLEDGTFTVCGAKIKVSDGDIVGTLIAFALDAPGRISVLNALREADAGHGTISISRVKGLFSSYESGNICLMCGGSGSLLDAPQEKADYMKAQGDERIKEASSITATEEDIHEAEEKVNKAQEDFKTIKKEIEDALFRAGKSFEKKKDMEDDAEGEKRFSMESGRQSEEADSKAAVESLNAIRRKERNAKRKLEEEKAQLEAAKTAIRDAQIAEDEARVLYRAASPYRVKKDTRKILSDLMEINPSIVVITQINGTPSAKEAILAARRVKAHTAVLFLSGEEEDWPEDAQSAFPDAISFDPYGEEEALFDGNNLAEDCDTAISFLNKLRIKPQDGIPCLIKTNEGYLTPKMAAGKIGPTVSVLCVKGFEGKTASAIQSGLCVDGWDKAAVVPVNEGYLLTAARTRYGIKALPHPLTEEVISTLPDDGRFIRIRITGDSALTIADLALRKEAASSGRTFPFTESFTNTTALAERIRILYPDSYNAALFDSAGGKELLESAVKRGAKILRPDINISGYGTVPEGKETFRLGLANIKGSEKEAAAFLKERNKGGGFSGIVNFIERCVPSRETLQSLIYAGAFDSFIRSRRLAGDSSLKILEEAKRGREAQRKYLEADKRLRNGRYGTEKEKKALDETARSYKLRCEQLHDKVKSWTPPQGSDPPWFRSMAEKEALGFCLSPGPLTGYERDAGECSPVSCLGPGSQTVIAGAVSGCRQFVTRKDSRKAACAQLFDGTGSIDIYFVGDTYEKYSYLIRENVILKVDVKVEMDKQTRGRKVAFVRKARELEPSVKQEIVSAIDQKDFEDRIVPLIGASKARKSGKRVLLLDENGYLTVTDYYLPSDWSCQGAGALTSEVLHRLPEKEVKENEPITGTR